MTVVALKIATYEPRIVRALVAVSKHTRATLGTRLAEIGLATGEDDVILAMNDGNPICIAELSRKLRIRHVTMQRLIDQLVTRGHIEQAETPLFRLSQKGTDTIAGITAMRRRMASDIEAVLGLDGVIELTEHLESLEDGFNNSLKSTL